MNDNKIGRFLKSRYLLTTIIVTLYFLYKLWLDAEFYPEFLVLLISAILILIENIWLYRMLILLNIFVLISQINYVVGRCLDNFPINTLQESYYWLVDKNIFYWNVAFWIMQISLIIYLISVEIKVYKTKNILD